MGLNYLLARHQTSLVRAKHAGCRASRAAHLGLARGYASRISLMHRESGALARSLPIDAAAA